MKKSFIGGALAVISDSLDASAPPTEKPPSPKR
jgi:hypothetical protein